MEDSVFDFYDDEKVKTPRKKFESKQERSKSEGCDFGFEYESTEASDSSVSRSRPGSVTSTKPKSLHDHMRSSSTTAQDSESGSSESDSDNDESLYSRASAIDEPIKRKSRVRVKRVDSTPSTVTPSTDQWPDSSRGTSSAKLIGNIERFKDRCEGNFNNEILSEETSGTGEQCTSTPGDTVFSDDCRTLQDPDEQYLLDLPSETTQSDFSPFMMSSKPKSLTVTTNRRLASNQQYKPKFASKPNEIPTRSINKVTEKPSSELHLHGKTKLNIGKCTNLPKLLVLPSIPIRLKSEAFYQNDELSISVSTDGRRNFIERDIKVNLTILHKYSKHLGETKITARKPKPSKAAKNKGTAKSTDRNIVEHRANWPEFNTTITDEANQRYLNRLGI